MENIYEIDDIIKDYLLNIYPLSKFNIINNILNNIEAINNLEKQAIVIDIVDTVEKDILELIYSSTETSDDIGFKIDMYLRAFVSKYICKLGLYFLKNTPIEVLDNVLNSYIALYRLEAVGLDYIEQLVNDDENDDEYLVATMIEYFSDIRAITVLEYLEEVDNLFIANVLKAIRSNKEPVGTSTPVNNFLVNILNIDKEYGKTVIYQNILELDSVHTFLTGDIDNLYFILNNYKEDVNAIAYEIVMNALASGATDIREIIEENLELENIEYIGESDLLGTLKLKLTKLINTLETRK